MSPQKIEELPKPDITCKAALEGQIADACEEARRTAAERCVEIMESMKNIDEYDLARLIDAIKKEFQLK